MITDASVQAVLGQGSLTLRVQPLILHSDMAGEIAVNSIDRLT
jgi:hypothetical protein